MKFDKTVKKLLFETTTTRVSEKEISYYFDDILPYGSDLNFIKSSSSYTHPKFDSIIFEFIWKGTQKIKVFSSPGVKSSKSDMGSATVTVFGPNFKESNAFFNKATNDVDYDPVLKTGEQVLTFVRSILNRDDRDNDDYPSITPSPPKTKQLQPA